MMGPVFLCRLRRRNRPFRPCLHDLRRADAFMPAAAAWDRPRLRNPRKIGSEPTSRPGANRPSPSARTTHGATMRTITLEEHFISPGFLAGPGREFTERLRNSGAPRREDLRAASGCRRQAHRRNGCCRHRHAGALAQFSGGGAGGSGGADIDRARIERFPRRGGEETSEALRRPSPPCRSRRPNKAAEELERRVRQQGFKGTLINGHTRGRYLDDKFFSPILERAEALNVPDLSAPDRAAEGGGRCAIRRVLAGRERRCSRPQAGAGTSKPPFTSSA